MNESNYDTTESIFTIPPDVTKFQKTDLIANSMARIKGTVMTVSLAVSNDELIAWKTDVQYCMVSIYEQLGQLEKLIEFEAKEDRHE